MEHNYLSYVAGPGLGSSELEDGPRRIHFNSHMDCTEFILWVMGIIRECLSFVS